MDEFEDIKDPVVLTALKRFGYDPALASFGATAIMPLLLKGLYDHHPENPKGEAVADQVEGLQDSISALSRTLDADQRSQLDKIVVEFFSLTAGLPHIEEKENRRQGQQNSSKRKRQDEAKVLARLIASEEWKADPAIRIGKEMCRIVRGKLVDKDYGDVLPALDANLQKWYESVAPDSASRRGRPKKETKKEK